MSHKAMQQRVVKIRRIDKLESLIQVRPVLWGMLLLSTLHGA